MSRSMKKLWILIIILLSLFSLGIILKIVIQSSSEVDSIRNFNADLRISKVQIINYEDINVSIRRVSYREEIKAVKFIFYYENNTEIITHQSDMEEIQKTYTVGVTVENIVLYAFCNHFNSGRITTFSLELQ